MADVEITYNGVTIRVPSTWAVGDDYEEQVSTSVGDIHIRETSDNPNETFTGIRIDPVNSKIEFWIHGMNHLTLDGMNHVLKMNGAIKAKGVIARTVESQQRNDLGFYDELNDTHSFW